MPTYTYQCENCGIRFDQYQKFSEAPLKICPECAEPALRKVYMPIGIVFKGKGFYATDNRSPSGQSYAADKEESTKKEPESKSETKSESKTSTSKSKED
ncbi:MAG: FmdB family zinc ribbon protein [Brevefilum sp.]